MNYTKYCKLNNIDPKDVLSSKMFWFYKEAEVASTDIKKKSDCLAPLPKAVPSSPCPRGGGIECHPTVCDCWNVTQQEGKTPMRYNDNYASASASVQAQPSDTAVQRDFLLSELAKADYPKDKELRSLFNLYVDNTPKTYKDMIAIIQAGTYTIDPKIAKQIESGLEKDEDFCYGGPMHGIIWPGPVSDYDGFNVASVEKTKQFAAAKRIIMTDDAKAGLAAIQAFEAWLPTPATPAN